VEIIALNLLPEAIFDKLTATALTPPFLLLLLLLLLVQSSDGPVSAPGRDHRAHPAASCHQHVRLRHLHLQVAQRHDRTEAGAWYSTQHVTLSVMTAADEHSSMQHGK
jgi:hypothetical protein